MNLYLSSYKLGEHPDKLLEMVGNNRRTAVICNAIDYRTGQERADRDAKELTALGEIGLQPELFDLRDYFDKSPTDIEKTLGSFGLIWIRGGNVFVLRKAMALSGFDKALPKLIDQGITYGGYSAGACVVTPTLEGIDLCDDPNVVPEGYPEETMRNGLDLVGFSIAPHYKSDHPETELIDRVVQYFEHHKMPYQTLRDGEVIIKDSHGLVKHTQDGQAIAL